MAPPGPHRPVLLSDLLTGATYDREGDELTGQGLFVSLDAWQCHVLAVE